MKKREKLELLNLPHQKSTQQGGPSLGGSCSKLGQYPELEGHT